MAPIFTPELPRVPRAWPQAVPPLDEPGRRPLAGQHPLLCVLQRVLMDTRVGFIHEILSFTSLPVLPRPGLCPLDGVAAVGVVRMQAVTSS